MLGDIVYVFVRNYMSSGAVELQLTIGSLSKEEGYGNESVSPKYNLAQSQLFRLVHIEQYKRTIL